MQDQLSLQAEIIKYGNLLLEKGLVTGTGGNISICLRDKNLMMITPSGMSYPDLLPEDIVVMDLQGNIVEGSRKPSIEKNMHREIYVAREDVNAVVHTHSIYASAVAATRQDIPTILDVMVFVYGGPIKTAQYAGIGTQELADNVVAALGSSCAALLANHGLVGVGRDLAGAFAVCELAESCAKTYVFSKQAGEPVILSDEIIKREKEDLDARYGQK